MKKYPKYKQTNIDWLGEIPEHWEFLRMKRLFKDVSIKNKPESELLSVTQNQGVVPRDWVENRMVMPSGNLESFKFIEKGDFAISLRSFEGGLEYCYHSGIISPAYTVLKNKRIIIDKYYKHLFKSWSFISELQTSIVGIREGKNISYPELSYSFLPIPPLPEQKAIAKFLDEKSQKIDLAISQKEKMIELLKERKQIIIQKAVTGKLTVDSATVDNGELTVDSATVDNGELKTINYPLKNYPLKNSGIEWLGDIPEHWEVKKISHLFNKIGSGTTPTSGTAIYYDNAIHNWLQTGDLNDGIIKQTSKKITDIALKHFSTLKNYPKGSLVIAMYGATIGRLGILDIETTTNQACCVLGESKKTSSRFMFYSFLGFRNIIISFSYGGGQPNISQDLIKSLRLPLPPLSEQKAIVKYIEEETGKMDKAIALQTTQIAKLKEYKQILIDNAVRGKFIVDSAIVDSAIVDS